MLTGNICTCNSPLITGIYCEQAFRDYLMWQLVGLSANYSLLSHRNVWQCISFLAIVQLVRKKKSIEHLLSRIYWFLSKLKCYVEMALVQWKLHIDIFCQDHCAWWKGLLQLLCCRLLPRWAPGQVLPNTCPAKPILPNQRGGWGIMVLTVEICFKWMREHLGRKILEKTNLFHL